MIPSNPACPSRVLRLLTATALASGVVTFASHAQAQVVIGGEKQRPNIEVYQVNPSPFGQDGWPYNVKRSKKSWASDQSLNQDPSKLSSRQVSPELIQAARLEQSGLSKTEAKDAASTLTAGLQAPQISGDKPNEARDPESTLPAVTTNQLLASASEATVEPTPEPAMADPSTTGESKNLADSLTPLGAPTAVATAEPAPAPDAKPAGKGRALFGKRGSKASGERIQVADNTPLASSNADQVLRAPDGAGEPVPDASPAAPVDKQPTMAASNSSSGDVASLSNMQSAPKLLGRISEDDKGSARQMMASAKPLAVPPPAPEPVANEPASAPEPEPVPERRHDAVAVLPSKAEEKEIAATPQPQDAPSDTPPEPTPAASDEPKPSQKGFWSRMFGSDDAAKPAEASAPAAEPMPVAAPAPEPVAAPAVEPVQAPEPAAVANVPATYTPSPSAVDKPKSVPQPAPVGAAPEPTPAPIVVAQATPEPEQPKYVEPAARRAPATEPVQLVEPAWPAPAPRAPDAAAMPAPMEPDPAPAEPVQIVRAQPEPQRVETPVVVATAPAEAKSSKPSFWDRLFADDDKPTIQPVAVAANQPNPGAMLPPGYEAPAYSDAGAAQPAVMEPLPAAVPVAVFEPAPAPTPAPEIIDNPAAPPRAASAVTITPPPEVPPAPSVPVMAEVPTFRVEAPPPAAPNKLSTPRLVPIAPTMSAMASPPPANRAAARPTTNMDGAPMAQINFLPASQMVDGVGQAQLKAVAEAMQLDPNAALMLNAYAKSKNESEARRISLNRALSVRSKLAELGIQPARIEINAQGDDTPSDIDGSDDRVDAILH